MVDDVLNHLARLVAYDTRNPPRAITSEHAIFGYASGVLEASGFDCVITDLGEGSVNLFASRGAPSVLFNVHLDTVPDTGAWSQDPHTLRVEDGRAIGLGACDIKGAAACLLTAVQRASGPCAILMNSDEEAGQSAGVRAACANLPRHLSACVVAEPTQCRAVTAHRGLVVIEVEFTGTAGHSSGHDAFQSSAIHRMSRWMHDALEWASSHERTTYGTQRGVRFNIGVVEGGSKANVVASNARLVAGFRPLPDQDSRALVTQLLKAAPLDADAVARVRFNGPSLTETAECRALAERLALELASPVDFWTEAALFAETSMPTIVFGPGDIAQAHAADEWIAVNQLVAATESYIRMIGTYA